MMKTIRIAAFSLLLGAGALSAMPASAAGGGLYLGFGDGRHGPSIGLQFGNDAGGHYRPRHHRRAPVRAGRACRPALAVNKARRMGVRNARLSGADHRVVRVGGVRRGHRVNLVFANAPRCPLIRG